MNKLLTILLFFGTLLLTSNSIAQTKTPYQKKTEALSIQFFKDLGVSPATIKKYSDTGDLGALFLLGNISEKLQTENGMLTFLKYKQDVKNAEKLKNATDFKRDADKKAIEEKKKEAQLAKQRDREEQREADEIERERKSKFERSDYVRIGNVIKEQFKEWAEKGEFEKTTDYESRLLKEGSNRFNTICFNAINERTKFFFQDDEDLYSNNKWLSIRPKNYDADSELYHISISTRFDEEEILTGRLKVSVKDALNLKNEFSTYQQIVEPKDWLFNNHNLIPSKVTLLKRKEDSDNGEPIQYIVEFDIDNKQPIVYSTKHLEINVPSLPLISFDYTGQAPVMIEKDSQKKLDQKASEQKELQEKQNANRDILFNSWVERAENAEGSERFKNKIPKDISKTDLAAFSVYNSTVITFYEKALEVKEDALTRKRLEQYELIQKEIEAIKEKKQKRDKAIKVVTGILAN